MKMEDNIDFFIEMTTSKIIEDDLKFLKTT
jgi:hypothetical protein